ncbi:hypothetical protein [Morganella morganii]|uniref:hypothetical protein n=1 Tax=Morganella morganii TaxID=582 RepID=UPI001E5A8FCB|nr:hypothetical protein [Morganella morganii]UFH66767.1 hypothetical protein KQH80_10215 [Morganella morganii]
MALYYKNRIVTKVTFTDMLDERDFDKVWKIGENPEYPGIYKCQQCGFEDVINRDCDKLPPCSHCSGGKGNTWQLLVLAQDAD